MLLAQLVWAILALSGPRSAFAGAWPMPAGRGQSIATLTWQGASRGFDRHGKARIDLGFSKFESALFIEYGLTQHWTLVARPAAQTVRLRTGDTIDEAQGYAASELSLRRALPGRGPWVFAAQAGLFIPGNVENGFDKPLGESGLDWEARLLAGRPLRVGGRQGFTDLQMAWRQRSRGSGNEVRIDTTLGVTLSRHVQVHLQGFTLIGRPPSRPGLRTVDSFKGQASAIWFFQDGQGLQLSFSRALAGRNVVRDSGITLGWWRRF